MCCLLLASTVNYKVIRAEISMPISKVLISISHSHAQEPEQSQGWRQEAGGTIFACTQKSVAP